jgi:hypothetical protein
MSLGSTVTPFPSLSGSGAWIYAATGDHLTGVTGA